MVDFKEGFPEEGDEPKEGGEAELHQVEPRQAETQQTVDTTDHQPEPNEESEDGGATTSDQPLDHHRIIPAEMWPNETCGEHGGKGWEVEIIKKKGKYSRVRFVGDNDGTKYENEWVETKRLAPVPTITLRDESTDPTDVRKDVAQPDDTATIEIIPNHNTLPPSEGGDPLKEPTRPARDRRAPIRYTPMAFALGALSDIPSQL